MHPRGAWQRALECFILLETINFKYSSIYGVHHWLRLWPILSLIKRSNHLDHAVKVFIGQLGPGGKAKPTLKQILAHRSASCSILEHGLKMHGGPDGSDLPQKC